MHIGRISSEGDAYRKLRDELLAAEIALRDQRERVAELRRQLPLETAVEDYLLHEAGGDGGPVRLSDLFDDPEKPLVIYQYMYGRAQTNPCAMCSMWMDGMNALAGHMRQRVNLAVVAEADATDLGKLVRERGWNDLRFLSSAGSSFKTDFGFQTDDGGQMPGVCVFVRETDGTLRLFYAGSAIMGTGEFRGLDLLCPVWHVFDLTPEGRGEWWPGQKAN